jgi:hypothetical protein
MSEKVGNVTVGRRLRCFNRHAINGSVMLTDYPNRPTKRKPCVSNQATAGAHTGLATAAPVASSAYPTRIDACSDGIEPPAW